MESICGSQSCQNTFNPNTKQTRRWAADSRILATNSPGYCTDSVLIHTLNSLFVYTGLRMQVFYLGMVVVPKRFQVYFEKTVHYCIYSNIHNGSRPINKSEALLHLFFINKKSCGADPPNSRYQLLNRSDKALDFFKRLNRQQVGNGSCVLRWPSPAPSSDLLTFTVSVGIFNAAGVNTINV